MLKYKSRYDLRKKMFIVTLKFLRAGCFRYNSEENGAKFPIPIMKLNEINARFPVQVV